MAAVLFCLSCSACTVLAVSFRLSCCGCPVLVVLFWLSSLFWCPLLSVLPWLSYPNSSIQVVRAGSPVLESFPDSPAQAVLSWQSCSASPVPPVQFHLSCLPVLLCMSRSLWMSSPLCSVHTDLEVPCSWQPCLGDPVLAVLSQKSYRSSFVLPVPFWLPPSGCPVLVVLFWLSSPFCPGLAFFSKQSCPSRSVLADLSGQFCPGGPVLAVLSWKFCPGSLVLPVMFRLFRSTCPICLSSSSCHLLVVLCWLSCSVGPFLVILSVLSCPGCLILAVLSWQPCPGSHNRAVVA